MSSREGGRLTKTGSLSYIDYCVSKYIVARSSLSSVTSSYAMNYTMFQHVILSQVSSVHVQGVI